MSMSSCTQQPEIIKNLMRILLIIIGITIENLQF